MKGSRGVPNTLVCFSISLSLFFSHHKIFSLISSRVLLLFTTIFCFWPRLLVRIFACRHKCIVSMRFAIAQTHIGVFIYFGFHFFSQSLGLPLYVMQLQLCVVPLRCDDFLPSLCHTKQTQAKNSRWSFAYWILFTWFWLHYLWSFATTAKIEWRERKKNERNICAVPYWIHFFFGFYAFIYLAECIVRFVIVISTHTQIDKNPSTSTYIHSEADTNAYNVHRAIQ